MANSVEEAGFWLPSEFFTDDDFLIDKENLKKNIIFTPLNSKPDSIPCFPTEFPYEKNWVMSTSPQSTLSRFPSPPNTPLGAKNDAVLDLIHQTAGQVAKMKLNQGLMAPPSGLSSPDPQKIHFQKQNRGCGVWYSEKQMYSNKDEMGRAACVIKPNPARFTGSGIRAGLLSGSVNGAVKRECAGTGVFLPRRYGNNNSDCNNPSDSRKKTGFSAAMLQNRAAAVDALTKSFDSVTGFIPAQPVPQPRLSRGFIQDYATSKFAAGRTINDDESRYIPSSGVDLLRKGLN